MNNGQPDWERREDRKWMEGIPEDWPLSEPDNVSINPAKCAPITMHMRQWEIAVAGVLDDYNDKKISKEMMVRNLKSLNKVKIK